MTYSPTPKVRPALIVAPIMENRQGAETLAEYYAICGLTSRWAVSSCSLESRPSPGIRKPLQTLCPDRWHHLRRVAWPPERVVSQDRCAAPSERIADQTDVDFEEPFHHVNRLLGDM